MSRIAFAVMSLLALASCPARTKSECTHVVSELEREVGKLPSKCARDSDCVCYAGGVPGVTNCGGVSDTASAARIGTLNQEFMTARCTPFTACAASLCTAKCAAGVCAP